MKAARTFAAIAIAALGVGLWPADGMAQQPVTIRLGHVGFPGSLFDISGQKFAQEVNQALKGKVEVRVFHSSQLGSDEQMIKGIRVGAPEMQIPSTVMSTVDQRYGVFEMPYLIVSRAHIKKAAENPAVQKALFEPLPSRGIRVLGVWENGFRHITNNVRPIVRPDDLKGIKLRVPGGVWRVKMFQAYGANPSPMPFAEVYSALASGVMDGQENPFSQISSAKFHEVQKFLSLTGHVYTPAFLIVSEDFWKKLPKDQQDAISRIARETGDFARAEGERLDRELQSKLAPPMKSNDPDKEAFIKASAGVYEEFGKQVSGGSELIKTIQSLR
ncbi:MAG TPA: TRAP transporter substrate-binding protein [Burkholderiales bacterium]|jgi:tripartite ATP-independent transporter DctP family solute receptor